MEIFNICYRDEVLLNYQKFLKNIPGYFALFYIEPNCRDEENFKSRLHLSPSALLETTKHLQNIELELALEAPGYEMMITSYFEQLVVSVSRKYFVDNTQSLHRNSYISAMARVVSYIENNYTEEIN